MTQWYCAEVTQIKMKNFFKNKNKKIQTNKGAAMLISVIFFLFISLAIISGLVSPSVRELKDSSLNLNSKKSYYLAGSGNEDAFYRLKNNMTIGTSEVITLNGNSTTTTIVDGDSGQKDIVSLGDVASSQRKISLSLSAGDGLSFSYGVQAGEWGFRMADKSKVDGSIYSNGPVVGTGNVDVTGSVMSANMASIVADQENGSGTPNYNFSFGTHYSYDSSEDIAQSFMVDTTGPLNKAQIYIKKTGHPSRLNIYVTHDIDGEPDDENNYLAKGVVSASSVSTSYGWITVTFDSIPNLISGQSYWLVFESENDHNNYYTAGANTSYENGFALIGNYSHDHHHHYGGWDPVSPSNADLFFKIYLQGLNGLINNIDIGENESGVHGNAYAHEVKNSSIDGINYCQTGSGNNKSCNTSLEDPVPMAMPISDQNIQDWKDIAVAGGAPINPPGGTYTPGGHGITLGPVKINGNLHLDDHDVLTLSGTIWITGNLRVDHRAIVRPDPSYEGSSVAIIVDGKIYISNDADFTSGNSKSYVLALTTSNCPFDPSCDDGHYSNNDAIELSTKVDAVILYASSGLIDIKSKAKARQLTGYGIDMGNDSDLIYDRGLINQNFIGNPNGGWNVKSWEETK